MVFQTINNANKFMETAIITMDKATETMDEIIEVSKVGKVWIVNANDVLVARKKDWIWPLLKTFVVVGVGVTVLSVGGMIVIKIHNHFARKD